MEIINKITEKYNCFRELMLLAIPVLIGELGHMLTGVADVAVISRYSTDALEAISIANSIIFTVFIFGLGIQNAISILLSKKRGEKENTKEYFSTVFLFSFILSVIFLFISLIPLYFVDDMGFETKLIPPIKKYILIIAFSMPGLFLFQGLKEFLQSFENVKVPNIILLSSVLLNIVLNFIFIFGYGFVPSMGIEGAALTTLFVRYIIAFAIFIYTLKFCKIDFKNKFDYNLMKQCILVGLPIGAAWMLEFLAFNLVTVILGRIDGTLAAAHNILATISSVTFAFPASVGIALCVKTAYHFGAGEPERIKDYLKTALVTGVGFMILISFILLLFPLKILNIYTHDREIIDFAFASLPYLALYQVFDGFQTVTGGLLKGLKKTGIVSLSVIGSYWIIGAPIAYFAVVKLNFQLEGFWIALGISLWSMSLIQTFFARNLIK